MPPVSSGKPESIALCLSGGGFRATLFHLGLIKALRSYSLDGTMALSRVKAIYSVSGGSILAAHLLRNWGKYLGEDAAFLEAERELRAFAGRNVRDRVLRRWGLTWWLGGKRGYWLQKEYEQLLGTTTIDKCYERARDFAPPVLHILATDFKTGELCSFSGRNFEKIRRVDEKSVTDTVAGGHLRIAYAVAASSAFPPLFPPVSLTPDMLGRPMGSEFDAPIFLADGGVYDNFGIEKFRMATRAQGSPDMLVVSHAGGSFDTAPGRSYSRMLSRNIRASDILMRRVGDSTLEAGRIASGEGFTLVRISETVDDPVVTIATQQRLRLVRTDLDAFGEELADLLIDHGCRIAVAAFTKRNWLHRAAIKPKLLEAGEGAFDRVARRAASRTFRSLPADIRDWQTVPIWWALAAAILATSTFVLYRAYETSRVESEAEIARQQRFEQMEESLETIRAAVATGNLARIRIAVGEQIILTETQAQEPSSEGRRSMEGQESIEVSEEDAARAVEEPPTISLSTPSVLHGQRVFIQFAGFTRAQITALNNALRESGWRAQGTSGERTEEAFYSNEVRYSGENESAARALANAINEAGITSTPVEPSRNPIIRPDELEVWISR